MDIIRSTGTFPELANDTTKPSWQFRHHYFAIIKINNKEKINKTEMRSLMRSKLFVLVLYLHCLNCLDSPIINAV